MTRHHHLPRPLVLSLALAAALSAGTLGAGVAAASDTGGGGGGVGDQAGGGAQDGNIEVAVTITGSAVGNGGTTASGGSGAVSVTVYTPPQCYWDPLNGAYTGADMWKMLQDEPQRWSVGGEASYLPSVDDVEAHKDDKGIWHTIAGGPNSEAGGDGPYGWDQATGECMQRLRAGAGPGNNNAGNAGYLWVPTGTEPPAAPPTPPTPEQLRDAALDALTLPVPVMTVNPAARTLVSLPTWFSVPGADYRDWDVTATAAIPGAPVVSATVTATPSGFSASSRAGSSGPCARNAAVNTWSPGESDESACTITFVRSSLGQPDSAYRVVGTTAYDTAWTSTVGGAAGPGGGLQTQQRTGEADVPVAESQALVRDAG